ncbi:capsid protein, partial [Klebsiella pneumoniae]
MAEEGLLVQSKHLFEINTEPGADPGNFVRLAAGFNSFEVALNEELDQTHYLDGDGYATSTVMGAQLTITFTGHRKFGDPAQDFIFSRAAEIGNERETEFR